MKEFPRRHWVVTGDLNDECTSRPFRPCLDSEGKDPWRDSLVHLAPEDRKGRSLSLHLNLHRHTWEAKGAHYGQGKMTQS